MGEAYLPLDPTIKLQAGLPLTKKDRMNLYGNCGNLKESIKQLLRQKDLEDYTNRGFWSNIPLPMASNEIERLLYTKGSLIMWYWKEIGSFMITPYATCDGLDFYGRYRRARPVPIGENSDDKTTKAQASLMGTKSLRILYDVQVIEDYMNDDGTPNVEKIEDLLTNSCVILNDRTLGYSNKITPRRQMQEGILDVMSDTIPFAATALQNSVGTVGMRVPNPDDSSNVLAANALIEHAARNQEKYVPIVGAIDFQPLTSGERTAVNEYMTALSSLNNFRLSCLGIDNTGINDKSNAYVNNIQASVNNVGFTLRDTELNRQNFCAIVNSIWNTSLWYELNQDVVNMEVKMGNGETQEQEIVKEPSEGGTADEIADDE